MADKATFLKALRDAFNAGRKQGSDEATAYEWGSRPEQSADKAFADFMESWNPDSTVLRELLDTLPDQDPALGTP